MLYREAGQFKTHVRGRFGDPARSARTASALALMLAVAFVVVPLTASPYLFSAILIPCLILALAALGLNILTGYAGQLSLGTAAFMAVGAFASYNFVLRIPGIPLLLAFAGGGLMAAAVGIVFGLPSLRIRGFYLAVATLAAQFFILWFLTKVGWFTNYNSSGVITAQQIVIARLRVRHAAGEVPAGAVDRRADGARREEHDARATSAGSGWRSATWTSRPR